MADFDKARALIREFKGDSYRFGEGVLADVGVVIAAGGRRAALVRGTFRGSDDCVETIRESVSRAGGRIEATIKGARPNSPREDLLRIADELRSAAPDVIVSLGGGSTIDTVKVAEVLRTLGGEANDYFGAGIVTRVAAKAGTSLTPHVAIQSLAGSASHLTKYANITDIQAAQKKLVIDEAIIPAHPVFDHSLTSSAPRDLTADGAMDGIAHSLEVLYGAAGKPPYAKAAEIASESIALIVRHLPRVLDDLADKQSREALCLATNLGGYSIMTGGTNGGHLTSFSLVDILSHGRACAIMNPYYSVFFAPAIQGPLRLVGRIYRDAGLTNADIDTLSGRALGIAVAEAMLEFARRIGFPTTLGEVPGFGRQHVDRALAAAKDPQLKSKLQNMPVPLTAETVDKYMGPVLEAARDGKLRLIRNV
ncbi:MAG TPA: iron-containing alcohol dehydrogenase [Planctomycetota bacterium]|nr:iron-containing alcohol dehydrogenase [Planctomycetota bacterium]